MFECFFEMRLSAATFIYFRFFDQSDPTNQEAMYLCWQDTLGNDNIDQSTSPDETWLSEYTAFVESQGVTLETLPSGYKAIPQNEFYNYFESFLDEFGAYDRHIVFNDNDEIETSRFEVTEVALALYIYLKNSIIAIFPRFFYSSIFFRSFGRFLLATTIPNRAAS